MFQYISILWKLLQNKRCSTSWKPVGTKSMHNGCAYLHVFSRKMLKCSNLLSIGGPNHCENKLWKQPVFRLDIFLNEADQQKLARQKKLTAKETALKQYQHVLFNVCMCSFTHIHIQRLLSRLRRRYRNPKMGIKAILAIVIATS